MRAAATVALACMVAPLLTAAPAAAATDPVAPVTTPTMAESAPDAVQLATGDGDINQQTGDFTYRYPFTLPKGRMGFTPGLGLNYSSANPVHGGIASGWSLDLPVIKADVRAGTDANVGAQAWDEDIHAIAPEGELVADPAMQVQTGTRGFRAAHDQSYVRFEYLGDITTGTASHYWWRALYDDGRTRYYGKRDQHPVTYAPLVRETNSHGDSLTYGYNTVGRTTGAVTGSEPRGFQLTSISYENPQGDQYARVALTWRNDPTYCGGTDQDEGVNPVGSLLDYRMGFGHLTGSRRLEYVSTWVAQENTAETLKPGTPPPGGQRQSREYNLVYDADTEKCSADRTPYRQLTSVQETALSPSVSFGKEGYSTVKPPVEFTYGDARPRLKDSDYGTAREVSSGPTELSRSYVFQVNPEEGMNSLDWKVFRDRYGLAPGELRTGLWLDVNRDGLPDFLRRPTTPNLEEGVPSGGCTIEVLLNRGDETFEKNPTEFSNFNLTDYLADVPRSEGVPADGAGELECGLNRSLSSVNGRHRTEVLHSFRDINGDGLPDLVSQPVLYDWRSPYTSTRGLAKPTDKSSSVWYTDGRDGRIQQYWHVYLNTGNAFSKTPVVKPPRSRSATAKPYTVTQASILAGMSAPDEFTETRGTSVIDVTGDGQADILENDGALGDLNDDLSALARGQDPKGGSDALFDVHVDQWPLGNPHFNKSGTASKDSGHYFYEQRNGLFDINGDGLADQLVMEAGSNRSDVYLNRGDRFGTGPGNPDGQLGAGWGPKAGLLWESRARDLSDSFGSYVGHRDMLRVLRDMDADGLVDVIGRDTSRDLHPVHFNGGSHWVDQFHFTGNALAKQLTGALSQTSVDQETVPVSNSDYDSNDPDSSPYWYPNTANETVVLSAEPMDFNGDGLVDLFGDLDGDNRPEVRYADARLDGSTADNHAPDRLMRTVRNGYGAKTMVDYRRAPEAGRWVASRITVHPGHGEPARQSRFSYLKPQRTADAYGNWAFRGFGEVARLNVNHSLDDEDNSSAVTRFDYGLDYRGRATRTVTSLDGSAYPDGTASLGSHVVSVEDRTYRMRSLDSTRPPKMDGAFPLRVVLPRKTETYTCATADGESLTACLTPAKRRTEEVFHKPLSVSGSYLREIADKTETSFVNGQGQLEIRRAKLTHDTLWRSVDYKIVLSASVSERQIGDSTEQTGSQTWVYDQNSLTNLLSETAQDGDGRTATTRYLYYLGGPPAGQPYRVWKPEQSADYPGGAYTEYEYDPFGLYPVQATNPAGHVIRTLTDYSTGATMVTQGPNYVCEDGSDSCSFDQAEKREATTHTLDGFGRALTTTRSPVRLLPDEVVARASYDDAASYNSGGADPASATVESLGGDGKFSHTVTETDGLGRAIRTVTQQAPHPAMETSYDYSEQGGLKKIISSSPWGTDTVVHRFERDSLGRAVRLYGPEPQWDTGAEVLLTEAVHDGFSTTTREAVTDGLSPAAEKTITTDAVGQTVEVAERTDEEGAAEAAWATTAYAYDGNGNLASVTDPDGAVTTMAHDWLGNRVSVTSSGDTWSYGYDLNGNLTSITEPHPEGQTDEAYTRTTDYDDLDRPITETPAVRDLTPEEQTAFKTGVTRYFYDEAHPSLTGADTEQQIGRLSYTTSPVATTVNRYDRFGNPAGVSQTLAGIGGITATGETQHRVVNSGITGTLENVTFITTGGHSGASRSYGYDQASQPYQLRTSIDGSMLTVAELTRNSAGLVTRRQANPGGTASAFTSIREDYTYTTAGQLKKQEVTQGGAELYGHEVTEFSANGRALTTRQQFGDGPSVLFGYMYDRRNQLVAAGDYGTAIDYQGYFTYTDGGRLASANVGSYAPAVRMHPRNVTYTYDPDNPQRLEELTKPDGTGYADYAYDPAGNTTTRTVDGQTVTQRWDGRGRLARVTREDGSAETYFYDGSARVAALRTDADGRSVEVRRTFGALETVYTPDGDPEYREQLILDGTVGRIDGGMDEASLEYRYTSPQGHEVLALNATDGAVMRATTYGPFGEVISQRLADGTEADKYTREFNGKEYDAHSGLHYYGHRYYDPVALRWTSSDPKYRFVPDADLTSPRRANLYTYTGNNPIGYVDPDGLDLLETMNQGATWVDQNLIVKEGVVNNAAVLAGAKYLHGVVSDPVKLAAAPAAVQTLIATPGAAHLAVGVVGWTTGTGIGSGVRELTVDKMFKESQARIDRTDKSEAKYLEDIYRAGVKKYAADHDLVPGHFDFQLDRESQKAVDGIVGQMLEEDEWAAVFPNQAGLFAERVADLKKEAVKRVAGSGSHLPQQSMCERDDCGTVLIDPVDESDFFEPAPAVAPPAAAAPLQ
ncbi:RHS repeat-associated core domain-containing protein [Streptomyces sp. HK10]|uniref:RHS repeat-associated core domain-containing protein n=1 Tax=Streptomyces sp. HK10 TaxID=3373255 RepID=UPI00374A303E